MFKFKKNGFNKIISCLLVLAFVMLSVPVSALANTLQNARPVALITGATRGLTNTPIALACVSTDRGGLIASRVWSIVPTTGQTNTLSGTGGNITFTTSGIFTVTLVVTDNQGATTTDTHTVSVFVPVNPPPVAKILGSTAANTGGTVALTCGARDSNGTITSRSWRVNSAVGQTNTLTGTGGNITFSAPGRYTLSLTVTDNGGATRTDTHDIVVRGVSGNQRPTAFIAAPTVVESNEMTRNNYTTSRRTDGTFWTWGLNSHGQLGDGTTVSRIVPVRVFPR